MPTQLQEFRVTTAFMHCTRRWLWLALLLSALPFAAFAQTTGVGFQAITIHDPVNGGSMPGYVFYPFTHATGSTTIGIAKLHATRNALAIPGAKPLGGQFMVARTTLCGQWGCFVST